jgi:hypothetical protein
MVEERCKMDVTGGEGGPALKNLELWRREQHLVLASLLPDPVEHGFRSCLLICRDLYTVLTLGVEPGLR